MPLYEYECQQCHEHVEKIQRFSAPEITVCPKCGGKLERVLSAPAVQFKGSGWYVSDYGAGKKSAAKGASEKASSEDKSSS
jgi:putative FmdB family regulatory protein